MTYMTQEEYDNLPQDEQDAWECEQLNMMYESWKDSEVQTEIEKEEYGRKN